jgi:2-oxoglutarate ferredoxin oxidoreductase subunit beta
MLESGASFVARGYPVKLDHLADIMVQAVEHEGFSFVDVLQPCVSFNNTYKKYNAMVEILDQIPATYEEAMAIAKREDKLLIGILYKKEKSPYHRELYADFNPVTNRLPREERMKRIERLLFPKDNPYSE